MKRCTRCGIEKPVAAFPPVRRSELRLQSWCRDCFAEVNAANYARNRDRERLRRVQRVNERRAEVHRLLVGYLRDHPCVDCGERDIVVLEFDHRSGKIADVSTYANGGRTWPTLLAEIEKCDVRCANCHRRATAARFMRRGDGPKRRRRPIQMPVEASRIVRACRVCGVWKPLAEFALRSVARMQFHSICLTCQRAVTKTWYARHVGRVVRPQRKRGTARRHDLAERVFTYLDGHPCVDCGETDPVILDFDHRGDKVANVSTMILRRESWKNIAEEIEKCEVRCANCHRRRTSGENGAYRGRLATREGLEPSALTFVV